MLIYYYNLEEKYRGKFITSRYFRRIKEFLESVDITN